MTHVNFNPDSINWSKFFEQQEGRGRYFEGMPNQRGFGVLSSIGKFLLPIVKNFAMSAGEEGVTTGVNVFKDLAEGKDFKKSVQSHGHTGLQRLASKVQQCGKGTKTRKSKKRAMDPFSDLV